MIIAILLAVLGQIHNTIYIHMYVIQPMISVLSVLLPFHTYCIGFLRTFIVHSIKQLISCMGMCKPYFQEGVGIYRQNGVDSHTLSTFECIFYHFS